MSRSVSSSLHHFLPRLAPPEAITARFAGGSPSALTRSNMDPNNDQHKAHLSHELIGGAAGYEAMKAYEQHCERNGKPESHQKAKELIAGFAAAEVDRLFETKGLNAWDREEAKRHAKQQAEQALNQSGQY